jgi:thiol-disulfide isomerase/thioredoxin
MHKLKSILNKIPGWAVTLTIVGVLYLTGLHTEAIGQVQRLLLATGIKKASMPDPKATASAPEAAESGISEPTEMVGTGFQMVDLEGKTVSFESLKGKVIFMNIWATWCPPCLAEMPNIHSLYRKVDPDKIAFVMLSVDEGGMNKVKKFIQKKSFTFPVYLPASPFPQEFQSPALPTTFIISPEGRIVAKQEGMAEYDTKEVLNFLQSMARK